MAAGPVLEISSDLDRRGERLVMRGEGKCESNGQKAWHGVSVGEAAVTTAVAVGLQ